MLRKTKCFSGALAPVGLRLVDQDVAVPDETVGVVLGLNGQTLHASTTLHLLAHNDSPPRPRTSVNRAESSCRCSRRKQFWPTLPGKAKEMVVRSNYSKRGAMLQRRSAGQLLQRAPATNATFLSFRLVWWT
jgi:hypothetical protein